MKRGIGSRISTALGVASAGGIVCFVAAFAQDPLWNSTSDQTNFANTQWGTNVWIHRIMPPGLLSYGNDQGLIQFGSGFDISGLVGITNFASTNFAGVVVYPLSVYETNAEPRARFYVNATGGVFLTSAPPAEYSATGWVDSVYGSPGPWLSGTNLDAWYAERDPSRQHLVMTLVSTSDLPDYLSAMSNSVGSVEVGGTTQSLLIAFSNDLLFVGTSAGGSPQFLGHAPSSVTGFSLYVATNLLDERVGGWALATRLAHASDPFTVDLLNSESNLFAVLATLKDTDGDGLSDSDEMFLYGTSTNLVDSDDDGLNDRFEVTNYGTDPWNRDSDGDWTTDGYEVSSGTNPHDTDSAPAITFTINGGAFYVNTTNLTLNFDKVHADKVLLWLTPTGMVQATTSTFATAVSYSLPDASNGMKTLYAQLIRPGATSVMMAASAILDTVTPTLAVTNIANNAVTNARWIPVSGIWTDNISAVTVRINGEWVDSNTGASFLQHRVDLSAETNFITVTATDAAGNGATQLLAIVQNTTGDTNAPVVEFDLSYDREIVDGVTNMLTNTTTSAETLYLRARSDDETALFSLSAAGTNGVSAGEVVQDGTQLWASVVLTPGTNLLTLAAEDAAGNTGIVQRIVTRDPQLLFAITNPVPYQVVNATGVVVQGIASLGFSNAQISVNGIACTVATAGDHVEFASQAPVAITGSPFLLQAEAFVNGTVFSTEQVSGHYEILRGKMDFAVVTHNIEIEHQVGEDCTRIQDHIHTADCELDVPQAAWTVSRYDFNAFSGTCDLPSTDETNFTQVAAQASFTNYFYNFTEDEVYRELFLGKDEHFNHTHARASTCLTFKKVAANPGTQIVIFQFHNMDYRRNPGVPFDAGSITYRGQPGFMYNSNVAFIVQVEITREYTISESDFTWPGYSYITADWLNRPTNNAGRWLQFAGFTNDQIKLISPVNNQEFAFQMAGPSMPTVKLHVATDSSIPGIQWRFKVGSPQTGHAMEYEDAPTSSNQYVHPPVIDSGWVSTNIWPIDWGTNFYGGHVTHVTVMAMRNGQVVASNVFRRSFYIVGDSLDGSLRNSYIDSLTDYDTNVLLMAKAIAQQESGGTHYWYTGYNIGTASHHRYPLREHLDSGGGYGVMQLTFSNFLNRSTIWNWKRNIDAALPFISNVYALGTAYLNTHSNAVTNAVMRRLEGYDRYNAGPDDRYYWWSDGPASNNGVAYGWTKFGYISCPENGATHGYRDFNNNGVSDPDGNPYNIPAFAGGPNECRALGSKYADAALSRE